MSLIEVLSYVVTVVGIVMCGFFLAFIFLGKRLAGEHGARQVIKYKGLELRTSSLITVLLVAVAVTLTPLGGLFWLESRKAGQDHSIELFVSGQIADESGRGLKGATATLSELSRNTGETRLLSSAEVGSDGAFTMSGKLASGKALKLETNKPGYRNQTVILGFEQLTFPSVLVKEPAP